MLVTNQTKEGKDDMSIIPTRNNNRNPNSRCNLRGIRLFQKILQDWFPVICLLSLRKVVISEIKKVLSCKDQRFCTVFGCSECGHIKRVPFTCRSRFCPSCVALYNSQRASSMSEKLLKLPHRHCIFTIPEDLRNYFLQNRSLLNLLFESAYEAYSSVLNDVINGHRRRAGRKEIDCKTGLVSILHTFARSSDWNPHVHCLALEGVLTSYGAWYNIKVIPYEPLRIAYQHILLDKMTAAVPNFKPIADLMYKKYPEGFYVRLPRIPKQYSNSIKGLVKYVCRYLGRPCIATSRIDSYDGQTVTYHYYAHVGQSDKTQYTKRSMPARDFVLMLAQHIQDPHFCNLRYYGIYSSKGQNSPHLLQALQKEKVTYLYKHTAEAHATRMYYSHWRGAYERAFGTDPLKCPCCGHTMGILFYEMNGKIVYSPPPRGSGCRARSAQTIEAICGA